MKNHFLLIPILAFALSCAKDKTYAPANTTPACLIIEIKDSATGQLINTFEYDANRRLTKLTSYLTGNLDTYNSYTYSGQTVSWQSFNANSATGGRVVLGQLNSDGNLKSYSTTQYQALSGQTFADTCIVTYTVDKKLMSLIERTTIRDTASNSIKAALSMKYEYTYTGGKLSKLIISKEGEMSQGGVAKWEYFYDKSTPTVKYNPLFNPGKGYALIGGPMADKIPVKSVIIGIGTNYPDTIRYNHTASVDAQGFPTKIRTVSTATTGRSGISTKLYTYTCP